MRLAKRYMYRWMLAATLLLAAGASAQRAPAPDADRLLAAANAFVSFQDVEMTFDMEVRRGAVVQKRYRMQVKAKDRDRMRIEFDQPAREKGRVLLRVKDKMWMFLPDLGKSMVISSRQSLMGSSFSNGDLLRTDLSADYTAQLLGDEDRGGVPAHRLELKARSADVTYDRIVLWVARADARPLRAEYFTRSGKRLKSLDYDQPGAFGKIAVNKRMTVYSDLKKDEVTVLTIVALAPDQGFADSLFVKENLDRR